MAEAGIDMGYQLVIYGYRFYQVYLDHPLALRNYEDALVLADSFWRMLTQTAVRLGGPAQIYKDMLAEDRHLTYAAIERYDQVDYVKLLRGEGENHRDVLHDHTRFLRDLAYWFGRDSLEARDDCYQRALERLDEALELLPDSRVLAMQRADLLGTRVSLLGNMGRYNEAWDVLDAITQWMDEPMPLYGQVVCGTLALQRGFLLLRDSERRDMAEALKQFAIALARAYVFGRQHRNQVAFEQLIEGWVVSTMPLEEMRAFVKRLRQDLFYVRRSDLPYQNEPPVLTPRRWRESWGASVAFFEKLLEQCQQRERAPQKQTVR